MKILIFTLVTVEICFAQQITEPTAKESDCFGEILTGNCSETNTRAYVKQVNAGVKYHDRYTGNDSCSPSFSAPRECCVQESGDCHGEYIAVTTDPYSYHKDCIGKNKCSARQATRMDTSYLTSCTHNLYPLQTTYMDVEFYCIDVNNITPLNNGNKQNNGQGSTLYLWSGDSSTYSELTVATHICSAETDCDGDISVLSMDFRFAPYDVNVTCIEDNVLTVTDGSSTNHFNCSSNNEFKIKTLYASSNNYITVTYTGTHAGGYLWLGFQTSTNGNLTINCQSPGQIQTCETSTTEEPTTTEQETTTQQTTTHETTYLQSTTHEATTGSLTSTEYQTFTTDNSSTTTDKETSGKSESPSSGNNTGMIAGIAAAIILIIIVVICVAVYLKIIKPRRTKAKQASTNEQPREPSKPQSIEQGDGLHAKTLNGNGTNVENKTKLPVISIQGMENNIVLKETKTESSNVNTINEHENNVEKGITGKTIVDNDQSQTEFDPGSSQQQSPPSANLIQDSSVEKRKKKKKKKKQRKNQVKDFDNVLQGNEVLALPMNEAVTENINENEEHSNKHKKKKKRKKTHENSSEVNGQDNLEEVQVRKEKKKKKKKRNERQSEDSKQEEENTTIKTQTIEDEHDTE